MKTLHASKKINALFSGVLFLFLFVFSFQAKAAPILTVGISSHTNVNCNGSSTGSATALAAGGGTPYTYTWTPSGGTAATATNLSAGTYTITVKDAASVTATASVTITAPAPIQIGSYDLTATYSTQMGISQYPGGCYPFTIPAGITTITITAYGAAGGTAYGGMGAQVEGSFTVTPGDILSLMVGGMGQFAPFGNGSGGGGGGSFVWNTAGNVLMIAAGGGGGGNDCGVQGANGSATTVPNPSLVYSTPACGAGGVGGNGGTGGNILDNVGYPGNGGGGMGWLSPGTDGAYFGSWGGGGGIGGRGWQGAVYSIYDGIGGWGGGGGSGGDFCGSGGGGGGYNGGGGGNSYNGYYWGGGGGGGSYNAGTVIVPVATLTLFGLIAISYYIPPGAPGVLQNVSCEGGNNGSVSVAPSGGTSPYTYLWSNSGTTASISNLTAGTYTLTVHDNNGCSATGSVAITAPSMLAATSTVTTEVGCFGGNTGNAQSTPSGGISPYTYLWQTYATTSNISSLSAGTFTLTVHDNIGCSVTGSVTITQPNALLANATVSTNVGCNGGNTGSAQSAPSGGTSPYTYTWQGGATTSSISSLSTGTFTLTVHDNHGCSATGSVTITQPSASLLANATVSANVGCNGGNTGSAQSAPSGGTSPYTYTWQGGATTSSISSLSTGTFTLTVHDNHGCSATGSVTITQPSASLLANATVSANVGCNGGNTGSAQSAPSGGTSPYSYSWQGGATTSNISSLTAGTFTLTVHDNHGCSATGSVTITQPSASLLANATASANVGCNGGNTGSAQSAPSGGTSPYAYSWQGGATTSSISSLIAGTYTLNVRDFNGCNATAQVTITQSGAVVVSWWSTYNISCFGGTNGKAISTVYGGTSPYTYLWTSNVSSTGTATGLSVNTYSLTVEDKNGCSSSAISITITQPVAVLTETITKKNDLNCHTINNGSATSNPLGGTSPYTYSWLPSGGTLHTSTNLPAGTDKCYVTDAHGCTATSSITITAPPVIFATFTKTIPYCNNYGNGSLTASGTGGTGPYFYVWAPYGGTNATASNLSAQTYTVTVTDNTGCSGTVNVGLGQPAPIAVTISGPTCTGNGGKGTVVANATGGTPAYHYSWSNGITTVGTAQRETFVNGSYTVTVGDGHNCPKGMANITFRLCPSILKKGADDKGDGTVGLNAITVYPNPTNGQFTITGLEQGQTIEMYDYTGRKISTISASDLTMQLNLLNQPNGIYLIRILDKDGNLVGQKKVVKAN